MSVNRTRTIDEFIADVKALGKRWIVDVDSGMIHVLDERTCPMAALLGIDDGLCGYVRASTDLGLSVVDTHTIAAAADNEFDRRYTTPATTKHVREKLIRELVNGDNPQWNINRMQELRDFIANELPEKALTMDCWFPNANSVTQNES